MQANKDRSDHVKQIILKDSPWLKIIGTLSVPAKVPEAITVFATKAFEKVTVFGDCKTNKLNCCTENLLVGTAILLIGASMLMQLVTAAWT